MRSGGLLFVHAGVNPDWPLETFLATPWNAPLSEIDESSHWAWVREPFLSATPGPQGFSGFFVVHGHSPRDLGFTRGHAEQIAASVSTSTAAPAIPAKPSSRSFAGEESRC